MSQHSPDFNDDTTVIAIDAPSRQEESPPFTAVAVTPGRKAPPHAQYLVSETLLGDEYTPGLNPLVRAASGLLLEIVRIGTLSGNENLDALRSRLEAEIRGFNSQAVASGNSESQVNAAQYLLCTALDEAVVSSAITGAEGEWQDKSLLSTFHNDTWGGEVFFDVLTRAMEQPASRLYLLELIYLLLSLGFKGKYRPQDRGPLAIESLRDQLYRQIRLLRGEPSPDLAKKLPPAKFNDKMYAYIPPWLIVSLLLFCMAVTYGGFSHVLENRAQPLLAQFAKHAPSGKLFIDKEERPEHSTPTASEQTSPQSDKASEPAPGSPSASEVRP